MIRSAVLIIGVHILGPEAGEEGGRIVFEGEPKINPAYAGLMNTFLLPHIGSATVETNTAMGMLALDNIDAVLAGRVAPSLVKI